MTPAEVGRSLTRIEGTISAISVKVDVLSSDVGTKIGQLDGRFVSQDAYHADQRAVHDRVSSAEQSAAASIASVAAAVTALRGTMRWAVGLITAGGFGIIGAVVSTWHH